MLKIVDILRRPFFYGERFAWKARRFIAAFKKTWLKAPEWVRARNRRKEVLDYGPLYIFLEAASGCNLKCPMCPTGLGRITRQHGFLKMDLAQKLVAELRRQPLEIGLWLAGEPLLNPALAEIVRMMAGRKLPVAIHTNGTLLTEELSLALIEAGLTRISFSFDGIDTEQYARQRPGADYEKTLANILRFLEIKKEMKRATPCVAIQVITPYAGEETHPYGVQLSLPEEFVRRFDGLPVDSFSNILAHSWSGQLADSPLTAPNHKGEGVRAICEIPYTSLTIAWNGDAVACCGDLNAQVVLGNLYRENLYELWNNEKFRAFRRAMHSDAILQYPLCGECERLWIKPHRLDYEPKLDLLRYRLRL
ncbi:MAG: radical SAM protein [Candidatus Sumerlaeota bacterium]|nr:radical SAM protein [Candidatus Sumerlaeota bacterium]